MLRTALLALVLGIGTPHLGGFANLFTSNRTLDAVEIGIGWDPWGGGDDSEAGDHDSAGSSGEEEVGHLWDPWG